MTLLKVMTWKDARRLLAGLALSQATFNPSMAECLFKGEGQDGRGYHFFDAEDLRSTMDWYDFSSIAELLNMNGIGQYMNDSVLLQFEVAKEFEHLFARGYGTYCAKSVSEGHMEEFSLREYVCQALEPRFFKSITKVNK